MEKGSKQLSLLDEHTQADNGSVVCLGMTFENDEARREYFRNELRKKLPELKQIEGFPIGEDEDIIVLSDPPYYTVCPNPWINDFIEEWEREKAEKYGRDVNEEYHREPFASDVTEGKAGPLYNAHSYHTKVPYKAIMKFLLHYTEPGDIVLDTFCGTGMTGVAAAHCENKEDLQALGFKIDKDKLIDENGHFVSRIGKRNAILNDLSTAASFIAHNYNNVVNLEIFKSEMTALIDSIENEYSWFYETLHKVGDSSGSGKINYVIWSDVFYCPYCS
ncbi:DNA methyltransferase, partial [Priestia megaterium]|uniref:DNA methyltransferase n=1 Tax=Priestia megaterium TaxID=1404 RepID=UPI0030093C23